MPYTFELSFTGLCIFTFSPNPTNPTEVNVLLLNHRAGSGHGPDDHLPFISYRPHDLVSTAGTTPTHELVPGPDGAQIARLDLTGKSLQVTLPIGVTRPLSTNWRDLRQFPTLNEAPDLADPTQEKWLDWVMALQRVNSATPNPINHPPDNGLK